MRFHCINIADAREALAAGGCLLDIRDAASFAQGHVARSRHLSEITLPALIADTPADTSLFILCYHGISSQRVAQYLACQGFTQVYSVNGGIEAWRQQFPQDLLSSMEK